MIIVIGFISGAASRKVMASLGFKPFCMRPRARGMLPHSQTGSRMPVKEIVMRRASGVLGRIFWIVFAGMKVWMHADMVMPSITNGSDS